MNRENVVIGMKVVPRRKSVGNPLTLSIAYKNMVAKKQPYLYVAHQHADEVGKSDRFMLSDDESHIRFCGDYFMRSDFEEYKE